MGQQATMESVAIEQRGGVTLFRRVVMSLTVVALMVVMLAASVAPAFAYGAVFQCTNPDTGLSKNVLGKGKHQAKLDSFTECHRI